MSTTKTVDVAPEGLRVPGAILAASEPTLGPQLQELSAFAREHMASNDIDPVYPMLRHIYTEMGLGHERALWFTFLYVGVYNLPTALRMFDGGGNPGHLYIKDYGTMDTGTERRTFRGVSGLTKFIDHVQSYNRLWKAVGSQRSWIELDWGKSPQTNFDLFFGTAQTIQHNGRWAAYKWAEILKKVHSYNLAAPDLSLQYSTGPKAGMMRLFGKAYDMANDMQRERMLPAVLRSRLFDQGVLVPDWEALETIVCDYNSLAEGRYYVGHDIDQLLAQIMAAKQGGHITEDEYSLLMEARKASFPHQYLGEVHGWDKPDARMKQAFASGRADWRR